MNGPPPAVTAPRSLRPGIALRVGVAVIACLAVAALATGARVLLHPAPALPVLVALPDFRLTSQANVPFGSAELRGHPYVADFIFTRCPSICPRLTARMQTVQARTGPGVKLVSFSVDPTYDTPARLAAYAQAHHAEDGRWTFLTGSFETMKSTIVQGFKIFLGRDGPDDDFLSIFHGTKLVLVDGAGQVRGYYDSEDPADMERISSDARRLVGR